MGIMQDTTAIRFAPHAQYLHNPTLTYHWFYIPTGERGLETTQQYESREVLVDMVNKWNAQAPGVWQYWVAP